MQMQPRKISSYASQWGLPLDRFISYAVKVLRDGHVETFESCEGGEGHAFSEPTIRFFGNSAEGLRAVAVALQHGLPVGELRRVWAVITGELTGPQWEMTFIREPLVQLQSEAERAGLLGSEVEAAPLRASTLEGVTP